MKTGITEQSTGSFYELTSRGDLRYFQPLLARNHTTRNLHCSCSVKGSIRVLIPRKLAEGTFTVVRDDVESHSPDCWLRREGDKNAGLLCRSSGIFDPVSPSGSREPPAASESLAWGRTQYDTFSEYARRIFSAGLARAFSNVNRGKEVYVNPHFAESMGAIGGAIRSLQFTDGKDGDHNAAAKGWRLRYGICYHLPSRVADATNPIIGVYWWEHGKMIKALSPVTPWALEPAVADLKIFNHLQAAPYFVLAVQNQEGVLQRIYFHQVLVDNSSLIPLDSNYEGNEAAAMLAHKAAVLKPVKMEDSARCLTEMGWGLGAGEKWLYRPDFFAFWGGGLHIREVRGFAVGTILTYDEGLARKGVYFSGIKMPRPVFYREVDGAALKKRPPAPLPETWFTGGLSVESIPRNIF